MMPCCPHCHRPLAVMRAGLPMPMLKARIYDAVSAAGEIGISTRDLMHKTYTDRKMPRSLAVIRTHVLQINDMLVETDLRIRTNDRRLWVLVKLRRKTDPQEATTAPNRG